MLVRCKKKNSPTIIKCLYLCRKNNYFRAILGTLFSHVIPIFFKKLTNLRVGALPNNPTTNNYVVYWLIGSKLRN